MTKKNLLIYLGGVVSGVVLTFAALFAISMAQTPKEEEETSDDSGLVMFEQPQQTIEARILKVIQVLPDGAALAAVRFDIKDVGHDNMSLVVLFLPKEGTSFFDNQIINIPEGKCLKQVGTYRYTSRQDMERTVPVVEILDK